MAAIHGSDGGGAMTADDGAKVGGRGRLTLDRLEVEGPPASAVLRGAGAARSARRGNLSAKGATAATVGATSACSGSEPVPNPKAPPASIACPSCSFIPPACMPPTAPSSAPELEPVSMWSSIFNSRPEFHSKQSLGNFMKHFNH